MKDSVLKKEFNKRDVERIRNLVKGKSGERTTMDVGYSGETREDHKEGDVWEESGKTWTIRNGVKRTVSRMESFHKQVITPIACPHCSTKLQSPIHKWAWNTYKMCFNCVVDMEHEILKAGRLEEYQNALFKANMESFYGDLEQFVQEFAKEKTTVFTEDGVKENWIDNRVS